MIKHVCDVCGEELGPGKKPRALGIEWAGFSITFKLVRYNPEKHGVEQADLCYDCLIKATLEGVQE